jgi:hypothetical protein
VVCCVAWCALRRASSAAQALHIENLKSQLKAAQESGEGLRADAARLRKQLAAREAAARSSQPPPGSDATAAHGGDPDAMTLAQAREVLSKMGEQTAQLAAREAQIHTLRAELASAQRVASDAASSATAAKRAAAARELELGAELSAARGAAEAAAASAEEASQPPLGGRAPTQQELACVPTRLHARTHTRTHGTAQHSTAQHSTLTCTHARRIAPGAAPR